MEDELFDYGPFKLRKDAFIHNIERDRNINSYIAYNRYDEEQAKAFKTAVKYITTGIKNGEITKNLEYLSSGDDDIQLIDTTGKLDNNNPWHKEAITYINIIAREQGKDPRNKRATEKKEEKEEEKEFGNFEEFFAKSINPSATSIADKNVDLSSWLEVNKGKEATALQGIFQNFKETGNPNPEHLSIIDSIIEGLKDNNVSSADKLLMNQMNISPAFYNTLTKLFATLPPKGKNNDGNNDGNNNGNEAKIEETKDVPPVTPPEVVTPELKNLVANASQAVNQGDYYIEGKDTNRKQYVLWDNDFREVPLSFINEEGFNNLKDLLQKGYRNRYEELGIENILKEFRNYINQYGLASNTASNMFPIKNSAEQLQNLLLRAYGIRYQDAHKILRDATTLKDRIYTIGTIPSYRKQGGIIKADGGTALKYSPNNPLYKTLYREGAESIGLANANNSLRSNNLKFNTTYDKELNLNNYYKNYKLYNNPEDRHADFLTWADKYYKEGDTIVDLLDRYNDGIDKMYQYKWTEDAITYKKDNTVYESNNTANFNTNYNEYYSGANKNIFGYDPNSIKIAGSATMARHPDITEEDITMDFSKSNITNEGLKSLLANNKLTKVKSGHYTYTPTSPENINSESSQKVTPKDKPEINSSTANSNIKETKLPEKVEPMSIPQETPELLKNLPFSLRNYLDTVGTNYHLQDLNGQRIFPQKDPIHLGRPVYGKLRVLAEANKRGAQRMNIVKNMFGSDGSINIAATMDAFNQNMEDWNKALSIDEQTYREREEADYQERKQAYLYNTEAYWQNEQIGNQFYNELIAGLMARDRSNLDSRVNLWNELKTYSIGDVNDKETTDRALAQGQLWQHIKDYPNSYIDGWNIEDQKLWDKYNSGVAITDPIEKQRIAQMQQLMEKAYIAKVHPSKLNSQKPSMSSIRLGVTPYKPEDIEVQVASRGAKLLPYMRKKGGNITNDMAKTIISYLKESNKNYNKAIDRSVKGLYNSIKLQKKKK